MPAHHPHSASESQRTAHPRMFGKGAAYIGMTSLAMLCPPALSSPTLTGAVTIVGEQTGELPLALEGPTTVEHRDVEHMGVTLRLDFDEPLLAYRRFEVAGGKVLSTEFTPGGSSIAFFIDGIDDASHVSLRVIDAVSDTGIADAQIRFRTLGVDYNHDGVRNVLDVQRFLTFYRTQEPQADYNDDGATNVLDIFAFLGYYNTPINDVPNAPPTIEIFGETDEERMMPRYAEPKDASLPIPILIRDDRLDESKLVVTAMSTNEKVVPSSFIEITGDGPLREVRFRGAPGAQGSAQVFLTVSDAELTSEVCFVGAVEENTAPTAIALADTFLGVAPLIVAFDASESNDGQNNITGYAWDFDGLGASADEKTSFVFATPGTYEVALTVTDSGGLTGTATRLITVADSAYTPGGPVSEEEARRFLWQAAFGPGEADVAYVMANGFEAWIDDQATKAPSYITRELAEEAKDLDRPANAESIWHGITVEGEDQLRQRIAWALSQIFAIRETGNEYETYSLFIKNAMPDPALGSAGNFREMLGDITYDLTMGGWLTFVNNKKANPETGTLPDQNYAREVQQLFTLGLWELAPGGSRLTDVFGDEINTYDQFTIEQFSRVFTGLRQDYPERIMVWRTRDHEFGESRLHDYPGAVPPGGVLVANEESEQAAIDDIDGALDNLFHHPSSPPFLAEQFIKRMVTSNPSPAYVQRVAEAYSGSGPYGSGVRGDLLATFKAILLDDEARNPAYRDNPFYGKTLEPIVIRAGVHRALNSVEDRNVPYPHRIAFGYHSTTFGQFGQAFMYSPSVFNFYRPDFAPLNTPISKSGLVAPELQIHDDNTALESLREYDDICRTDQLPDDLYAELVALSTDPEALVDWSITTLHYGATDPEIRQIIVDAITASTNSNPEVQADRRIRMAIGLVILNPGFRHLR